MLFHRYLEEIMGNKPALSMLRAMVRQKGMIFTVRRLADEAKISINECALTTQHLERFGIINIQPIGKAYHLTLNEKSYILNQIIQLIFDAEKNTIQAQRISAYRIIVKGREKLLVMMRKMFLCSVIFRVISILRIILKSTINGLKKNSAKKNITRFFFGQNNVVGMIDSSRRNYVNNLEKR